MTNIDGICGSSDHYGSEAVVKHESEFAYISDAVSVYFSGNISPDKFIEAESSEPILVEKDKTAEFVANGYLAAGIDFLKSLEGKFSLILIDHKIKTVLLTSQKAAILYRLEVINKIPVIIYSNTVCKLANDTLHTLQEDREAIYKYVVNNDPPLGKSCLYKNLFRLEEAQILIWQKGKVQILDGNIRELQTGLFEINFEDMKNYLGFTGSLPMISIMMEENLKRGARKNIDKTQLLDKGLLKEFSHFKNRVSPDKTWMFNIGHNQLIAAKRELFSLLLNSRFNDRHYWQQMGVMRALQDVFDGTKNGADTVLRIILIECWFSIFGAVGQDMSHIVGDSIYTQRHKKILRTNPNANKTVKLALGKNIYHRFPLKTEIFKKGDDAVVKIGKYVITGLRELGRLEKYKETKRERWIVVVSEKVIAIAQGRSKFIWEINPGYFAKLLSGYVTKTSAGIGLGSPWTMQLAIEEVGLPRIILAAMVAAVTKYFGYRGAFYHIAGGAAAAIDGPTEYSLFPSNISAKLGPKNPKRVAKEITAYLRGKLPKTKLNAFDGVAIIDANDLGQKVLGNDTAYGSNKIRDIFRDNPMGQGNEQTPITVVFAAED